MCACITESLCSPPEKLNQLYFNFFKKMLNQI